MPPLAWQTALSNKLTWGKDTSITDVQFVNSALPRGMPAKTTCVLGYQPTRDAYFWWQATMELSTTICFTSNGRQATLRHEIGHLIGRFEAYLDNGGCNSAYNSIMDGPQVTVNDPNCSKTYPDTITGACDGINVTSQDVTLANSFWGAGYAGSLNAVPSGSKVTITFKDFSWAEYSYKAYFYKKIGTTYVLQQVCDVFNGIGSHNSILDRTITYTWTGSGAGSYKVDVKPYFYKYNQYGTTSTKTFNLTQ